MAEYAFPIKRGLHIGCNRRKGLLTTHYQVMRSHVERAEDAVKNRTTPGKGGGSPGHSREDQVRGEATLGTVEHALLTSPEAQKTEGRKACSDTTVRKGREEERGSVSQRDRPERR